jgi:hypothetical protein
MPLGAVRGQLFENEDANYDKVSLLTNFDNPNNGAVAFFDYSKNGWRSSLPTASSATIGTSVFKFSQGALNCSAVPTNLAYNQTTFTKSVDFAIGSANFGTGDFTIEMWVYPVASSGRDQQIIMTDCSGTSLSTGYTASTGIRMSSQQNTNNFRILNDNNVTGYATGITFTTGQWQHVALTRASGTIRFFKDGVVSGTTITGATGATWTFNSNRATRIGCDNQGQAWSGHIDDVRITVGLARYTASFTAPTYGYKL